MKSKRNKILILILILITAAAVGVTVWAVWFRGNDDVPPDDYAPRQVDKNALPIDDEEPTDKLSQAEGGGAVSLTYMKDVTLNLGTKEASILFQNPFKSNQDMALQLVIDNKIIAGSDKLPPGYKLSVMTNVDVDKLSAGTYEGKFVVLYYNAGTGEKAIVNTEIPVTITVD